MMVDKGFAVSGCIPCRECPHSRSEMESRLAKASSREEDLKTRLEQLETEREEIQTEYSTLSQTSLEKIADLETQLKEATERVDGLQLELETVRQEVGVAKEDARKYSEQATGTEETYERELLQHGKSMENLHRVKDEVGKNVKMSTIVF